MRTLEEVRRPSLSIRGRYDHRELQLGVGGQPLGKGLHEKPAGRQRGLDNLGCVGRVRREDAGSGRFGGQELCLGVGRLESRLRLLDARLGELLCWRMMRSSRWRRVGKRWSLGSRCRSLGDPPDGWRRV